MPSKQKQTQIEPRVSDHALVRYLERVMGLDVESIRREIMTTERAEAIMMGAKKIIADKHVYIIENGVIVTVLYKNPPA